MRLKAVGGNLTTDQLRTIVGVADKYGAGWVHLSTRQGVEIHHIRDEDLEDATAELAAGPQAEDWTYIRLSTAGKALNYVPRASTAISAERGVK